MAADARALLVRPHHHGHGVPADDALDAPLDLAVAGIGGLLVGGNRVDVGRGGGAGTATPRWNARCLSRSAETRPALPPAGDDVVEGVEPFGGFLRVVIRDWRTGVAQRATGPGERRNFHRLHAYPSIPP